MANDENTKPKPDDSTSEKAEGRSGRMLGFALIGGAGFILVLLTALALVFGVAPFSSNSAPAKSPPVEAAASAPTNPPATPVKAPEPLDLSAPPLTNGVYVQAGVCPFEGCVYGAWRATAAVILYKAPDETSAIVATIPAGERVEAQTGEVHVQPLKGRVVRALGPFQIGDTVYRMSYQGEGTWDVWRNGKIEDTVNLDYWGPEPVFDFGSAENSPSRNVWWARVKRANGDVGWTKEGASFEGSDSLG